jgi:putative FmdB family regulatory protein
MPRYDYRCPKGHVWELTRKFGERDKDADCPECGAHGTPQVAVPAVAHVEGGTGAQSSDRA